MKAIEASTYDLPQVEKGRRVVLTLRLNFAWTFLGNVGYAACQWGMLVVLAKFGSPEMVGQFALGLAITAPVFMFTNLQLRSVQATDAREEYTFGDYLALRIVTTLLALGIIGGILLVADYRRETAAVVMAVGLAKACESLSDVYYGALQYHERMDQIARSMLLKGSLSLVALGLGVIGTGSVLWGTFAMATTWGMLLVAYDMRRAGEILRTLPSQPIRTSRTPFTLCFSAKPRWDSVTLRHLIRLSLPLGVAMTLISLNTNIPRYFIEQYVGERELGIFAALAYLMVAGSTVTSALGQSASPRLARYHAEGHRLRFSHLLLKLCLIGAILGASGIVGAHLAGRELLTLLYRAEYAEHTTVFLWLMLTSGINYVASFLGYGMTAMRLFMIQTPLFVLTTATTLVTSAWWVPQRGLLGAAQATVASAMIGLLGGLAVNLWALRPRHIKTEQKVERRD